MNGINENRDSLKRELVAVVRDGKNAKELLETQGVLLNQIKKGILEELAMTSAIKQTTVRKFLWFTISEETRGGLQHIEALQADLRVILGYEALLSGKQQEAETAKANLESLRD